MAMQKRRQGRVIIPAGTYPWPHELRVAEILSTSGYVVEFLPRSVIRTADVLVDGVEFEIKSPISHNANTIDHMIRKALRQAPNLVIDGARTRCIRDLQMRKILMSQARKAKLLKRMLYITKSGQVIDIMSLI